MNRELVDRIVAATLYEGYILYPYRPSSVKNQVRWTFGGVYPRSYSEASGGTEPWTAVTECLLRGDDDATVEVTIRFLHVVARTAARLRRPAAGEPAGTEDLERIDHLELGGRVHRSWEEAAERTLDAGVRTVGSLLAKSERLALEVPAGATVEWLRGGDGLVAGALVRENRPLAVDVELSAARVGAGVARVRVSVANVTAGDTAEMAERGSALRHALVSTHAILGTSGGAWLSLADPPADAAAAAAGCVNTGLWPVLVGDAGSDDTVLASPIILEDHPQVAAQSPGDLFDATEIDEILSLRILALTDAEKAEMRMADERARAMLDRTEALTQDDFLRMHGVLRPVSPRIGGQP